MKAIHTKHLPATNTKPTRIKAWASLFCTDGWTSASNGFIGCPQRRLSVIISNPDETGDHMDHFEAVKALIAKHNLQWDISQMVYGDSADGKGHVFCFANSKV